MPKVSNAKRVSLHVRINKKAPAAMSAEYTRGYAEAMAKAYSALHRAYCVGEWDGVRRVLEQMGTSSVMANQKSHDLSMASDWR